MVLKLFWLCILLVTPSARGEMHMNQLLQRMWLLEGEIYCIPEHELALHERTYSLEDCILQCTAIRPKLIQFFLVHDKAEETCYMGLPIIAGGYNVFSPYPLIEPQNFSAYDVSNFNVFSDSAAPFIFYPGSGELYHCKYKSSRQFPSSHVYYK